MNAMSMNDGGNILCRQQLQWLGCSDAAACSGLSTWLLEGEGVWEQGVLRGDNGVGASTLFMHSKESARQEKALKCRQ